MNIIEKLEELNSKATQAPWDAQKEVHRLATFTSIKGGEAFNRFGGRPCVVGSNSFTRSSNGDTYEVFGSCISDEDAELITTMRNTLPALLNVVKAAEAVINSPGSNCVDDVLYDQEPLVAALKKLEEIA